MKNKKLNLNDLKVESFVTALNEEKVQTVKGGTELASVGAAVIVASVTAAAISLVFVIGNVVSNVLEEEAKKKASTTK